MTTKIVHNDDDYLNENATYAYMIRVEIPSDYLLAPHL